MEVTYDTNKNRIKAFFEIFDELEEVDRVIRALQFFRRHMAAEKARKDKGKPPKADVVKLCKKLEEV